MPIDGDVHCRCVIFEVESLKGGEWHLKNIFSIKMMQDDAWLRDPECLLLSKKESIGSGDDFNTKKVVEGAKILE